MLLLTEFVGVAKLVTQGTINFFKNFRIWDSRWVFFVLVFIIAVLARVTEYQVGR